MKKISLLLALTLLLGIFALGGCGAPEPSPLDGKWIGIGAEMMGIKIPVEEVFGGEFSINISGMGKAEVTAGDVTEKDKWTLDGNTFTLSMRGADCVGTWNDNVIVFDNMLDSGVAITFAREGSDAENSELYDNTGEIFDALDEIGENSAPSYIAAEDEDIIGAWKSIGYCLSPGDEVTSDMEGTGLESVEDILKIEFFPDNTLKLSFVQQVEGSYNWSIKDGFVTVESEKLDFDIRYRDDGVLEVFISGDDSYMEVYCRK